MTDPTSTEATSSTSLDQPGTGAGYTAVEPQRDDGSWADGTSASARVMAAHRETTGRLLAAPAGPVVGGDARRALTAAVAGVLDADGERLLAGDEVSDVVSSVAPIVAALVAAAEQRGQAERDRLADDLRKAEFRYYPTAADQLNFQQNQRDHEERLQRMLDYRDRAEKAEADLAVAEQRGAEKETIDMADALPPIVAALLSSAREEGANAAPINEARRRCPSCEHLIDDHHQPDGCWYTVAVGEGGANLVCPCGMSAALAQHALDLTPVTELDPIGTAREEGAAAERERIATALETRAEFGLSQWVRDEAQRQTRERAEQREWYAVALPDRPEEQWLRANSAERARTMARAHYGWAIVQRGYVGPWEPLDGPS